MPGLISLKISLQLSCDGTKSLLILVDVGAIFFPQKFTFCEILIIFCTLVNACKQSKTMPDTIKFILGIYIPANWDNYTSSTIASKRCLRGQYDRLRSVLYCCTLNSLLYP